MDEEKTVDAVEDVNVQDLRKYEEEGAQLWLIKDQISLHGREI